MRNWKLLLQVLIFGLGLSLTACQKAKMKKNGLGPNPGNQQATTNKNNKGKKSDNSDNNENENVTQPTREETTNSEKTKTDSDALTEKDNSSDIEEEIVAVEEGSKKEEVVQTTIEFDPSVPLNRMEILFVVDARQEFQSELQRVAHHIDILFNTLEKGLPQLEYSVATLLDEGVVKGVADAPDSAGELFSSATADHPKVLRSDQLKNPPIDIKKELLNSWSEASQYSTTSNQRNGLFTLMKATTTRKGNGLLEANKENDFFDRSAGLAVIFITGGNDICGSIKAQENNSRCHSPEVVYNHLYRLKVNGGSDIYPGNPQNPIGFATLTYLNQENETGQGYKVLSNFDENAPSTLGTYDLNDDIQKTMKKLGQQIGALAISQKHPDLWEPLK